MKDKFQSAFSKFASGKVSDMTHRFGRASALLALAVTTLVPLGAATAQGVDPLNEVNPRVGFSSVSRAYADMDARFVRKGNERTVAQVRRIALGQTAQSLQPALGHPAYGYEDGSYEYLVSLPLTGTRDRLICQYRVFFDGEGKVERAVWRRPQCADLVLGRLN